MFRIIIVNAAAHTVSNDKRAPHTVLYEGRGPHTALDPLFPMLI
jgi:hypothetical protein